MIDPNVVNEDFTKTGKFFATSDVTPKKPKPASPQKPTRTSTQEAAATAVNEHNQLTQQEQPRQISFSQAIQQARQTAASINPNAVYGMNEADAIKYAQRSVSDMEQKMAQIANLSGAASVMGKESGGNQVANTNTNVSNHTNNVTQVTSDYLRNIRSDYQRSPQWRADIG